MRRYLTMKLPLFLSNHKYKIVKKTISKSVLVNGVEIITSPDVIFKLSIENITYVGAVKIHIAKTNVFDYSQQKSVATTIYQYLKEVVAVEGEQVNPELCLSIDVFGGRYSFSSLKYRNVSERCKISL